VDFHADDIHQLEKLGENRTHILHMSEQTFRADISLSAENDVAADGEVVIKVPFLGTCLRYKFLERGFGFGPIPGLDFEVRVLTTLDG
jgi:hypothetical protein